jgi:uncharacterized protein YhdP
MAEKGGASWQGDKEKHHLSVDNLTAHIYRDNQSWGFHIPDTRISMDDKPWPRGALAMAWIPAQDVAEKMVNAAMSCAFAPATLTLAV